MNGWVQSECCGNCKWHKKDTRRADHDGDWWCVCKDGDNYMDYTDYSYHCPDWQERGQ